MRAKITQVGELTSRKTVDVVYDILKGRADNETVVASSLTLSAIPSEIVERIKKILSDYEDEENLANEIKVGQVIRSDSDV